MPSKDITRQRAANRANHARTLVRNLAFVAEVNARTVCAHCGAQPIEWHNPEHVLPGRSIYRIGHMARNQRSIAAIQAEMDRCTPLCRRCHMQEDGRMERFKKMAEPVHAVKPPKPCINCQTPAKPLRKWLCSRCESRRRYYEKTETGENRGAAMRRAHGQRTGWR